MAKIKQRFKELLCWLRGGCVYHDTNMEYTYDVCKFVYKVRNTCVRCGKTIELSIPAWFRRRSNQFYIYERGGTEDGKL